MKKFLEGIAIFDVFRVGARSHADDYINQYVAGIFEGMGLNPHFFEEIGKSLVAKRSRARDEEEYMEVLIRNIQFFVDMEQALFQVLGEYLADEYFPGPETFPVIVEELVREKRESLAVADEIREAFDSVPTPEEKLDNLVFDFYYHRTYYSLIGTVLDTIIASEDVQIELVRYEPEEIVSLFDQYCNLYANVMLGNVAPGSES